MSKTPIWKQIVLSAVLIGVAAGAWHYRTQIIALWQPAAQQAGRDTAGPGVPVLVAEVALAEDSLSFAAVGTGLAQRSVTLRAPSGGEVTELNIAPGKRFAKGDVLMRLEDEDQRLALSLAEARQERAQSEQERYTGLRDTGVTTAQRFEDAMTAFRIAEIELEQARADLADRVLRAPSRASPVWPRSRRATGSDRTRRSPALTTGAVSWWSSTCPRHCCPAPK